MKDKKNAPHNEDFDAMDGIRTRAAAVKGRCPRPLDDGGSDLHTT